MAYDKDKIFQLILLEIEEGASLRSILRRDDMPERKTFFDWLNSDDEKCNQYAKACEVRADNIFEDILDIADREHERYIDDKGNERIDPASVQKKRLQIDARKWMLGKMQPKKYGDRHKEEATEEEEITEIKITRVGN